MAIIGGNIGGVAVEATLNGRVFPCASDASVGIDIMSTSKEVAMTGNGIPINKSMPKTQKIEGLTLSLSDANYDLEYLQDLQASGEFFAFTVQLRSGKIYSGSAVMTGDISLNSTETTVELVLEGTGFISS